MTLIVDRLLNKREKMALLKKMNMVIGGFFSELGRSLLESFKGFDSKAGDLGKVLLPAAGWTEKVSPKPPPDAAPTNRGLCCEPEIWNNCGASCWRREISWWPCLKSDDPYLYFLAVRMNPFDPDASPGIR